jgi:head-tail adaptor
MTATGDLDRRVTVRRLTEIGRDPFNEPIYEMTDLMTVCAGKEDVSDAERYAAGTVSNVLLSRFVVRSSAAARSIVHSDTIVHDGHDWNIAGIKEARDGRFRFLEIAAKTGEN